MLRVVCKQGAERRLKVALGRDPTGPKLEAGDQRTPEGLYRIAAPPRPSRFHRFVLIDYPSPRDADRALEAGRIGEADHARILGAHAQGELPPQDTPLGGGLGLHGEGKRWNGQSTHLDWTYGCVALSDTDIDFIAERAPPGTLVVIRP